MRIIHDISIPLSTDTAVWPGDTPFQFELNWKMSAGASVNVGTVTMSVHTGTHVDAPFHFDSRGTGAGEMNLTAFLGTAVVVDVSGCGNVITWDDLADTPFERVRRLLLKTSAWTDHSRFPESIPTVAPDVPGRLAAHGVILLGLDVPSVDAIDSTDLPNHHALYAGGISILESLNLAGVAPGEYFLSALPLSLAGADGSPVRAALWESPG